jgi:hypothetical protein
MRSITKSYHSTLSWSILGRLLTMDLHLLDIPGRPKDSLDVVVQVLSVNQCDTGNIMLHAPEGKKKFSFESKNMTVLSDGYILSRRVCVNYLTSDILTDTFPGPSSRWGRKHGFQNQWQNHLRFTSRLRW